MRTGHWMKFVFVLLLAVVVTGRVAVAAEEHAAGDEATAGHVEGDEHGDSTDDAHHEDAAGHGEHDPYDLTHANPTAKLEDITEVKADLAVWTLVVFLLLLAILYKFAWGPITEALERREKRIAADLEEASRQNEEAKRLLADHEAKLAAASEEVRGMLDKARKDADTQKQQIIDDAQQAAKSEKERALREIGAARDEALRDLADKSVGTAVDLAGRIVGRQLSQDDHAQLIQDALQQFPSKN